MWEACPEEGDDFESRPVRNIPNGPVLPDGVAEIHTQTDRRKNTLILQSFMGPCKDTSTVYTAHITVETLKLRNITG